MLPVRGLRQERRVGHGLPRGWGLLFVAFVLYTVLRLVQMTVWLVEAVF